MPSPPLRRGSGSLRTLVAVFLGTLLVAVPAAAQQPRPPGPGTSPLGNAVGAALVTLLIGGALILVSPEYTTRATDRILDDPVKTFLYGAGISLLAIVVIILLFITVVGVLVAVPIVIVAIVVSELGYLAAGRVVTDEWPVALLVAIALAAVAGGVPLLGGLLGLLVSCTGIGAAFLEYQDADSGASTDTATTSGEGGQAQSSKGSADSEFTWGADRSTNEDEDREGRYRPDDDRWAEGDGECSGNSDEADDAR